MRLTIIILFVVTNFFFQKNWSFGLQQGTIVQQQFNPIFESILQENYKETFTFTRDLYFKRNIKLNDRHSISMGFTFMKRKLRIKNYTDTVFLIGETIGGGGSGF
jgi:cellobiose-specific phosphotransferase system component IIC